MAADGAEVTVTFRDDNWWHDEAYEERVTEWLESMPGVTVIAIDVQEV